MEKKKAAKKFKERWLLTKDSELGGYQKFWISLLGDVLGAKDVLNRIDFQLAVPMGTTTKFLDAWIPETKVLIEHKKRGVKLDAPQSGHGGMTPYEQAVEYDNARGFDEKARWIVTCNFDEIRIYDRARPLEDPEIVTLGNLPKELHRLAFLVNPEVKKVDVKELEISVQAGRIVGTLYDALLKQYDDAAPETLAALNRLCVRLVFCLYAEDADIFPKNAFCNLVKSTPVEFLRRQLLRLFQTLDTPIEKRDRYLEPELAAFPYTNGGLFDGASESEIPPLTEEIVKLLDGSSGFDWSGISPTIFGALFESTLNPETRRSGGMHYTSIENIHKLIDPLFLDDLTRRVDALLGSGNDFNRAEHVDRVEGDDLHVSTRLKNSKLQTLNTSTKKALLALQSEIASLKFLDPACGSGNFQTETYISLRRLENRIIAALQAGQGEFDLGDVVKVNIGQFYGIEINDFAVTVAKTALWIAESQMMKETEEIVHRSLSILPLKSYSNIVEGNALRMDWGSLGNGERGTGNGSFDYIIGNPPFVGHQYRAKEQMADMDAVYADCKDVNYGKLDYVCAWYKKAVDYISAAKDAKSTRVAFVSTNSICQGESVAAMWKPLFEMGLEIDFAHRTFRWDNEAQAKAHVHCVIVGFHVGGEKLTPQSVEKETSRTSWTSRELKRIFDGDKVIEAEHINGYLIDAPDVFIDNRGSVLMPGLPKMSKGSQPTDGGNLFLSQEGKDELIAKYPHLDECIRQFSGAEEFINNKMRYCLWLKGISPKLYRVPEVLKRLEAVAELRRKSPTKSVQRDAETPMLFTQIRQPETDYLLIPRHSSEKREYIPIGYMNPSVICGDAAQYVPNASPYIFGVLTSSVHMAWMRVVAGRLEMRYRYTPAVYNNFPWPEAGNDASAKVLPITNSNTQSEDDTQLETGNIGTRHSLRSACSLPYGSRTPAGGGYGNISTMATLTSPTSASLRLCVKNKTCSELQTPNSKLQTEISRTAQAILDARVLYPDSSLADLYDPLTMPPELRKAHAANDRAVLSAYGLAADSPEHEIVAHLFKLYASRIRKVE